MSDQNPSESLCLSPEKRKLVSFSLFHSHRQYDTVSGFFSVRHISETRGFEYTRRDVAFGSVLTRKTYMHVVIFLNPYFFHTKMKVLRLTKYKNCCVMEVMGIIMFWHKRYGTQMKHCIIFTVCIKYKDYYQSHLVKSSDSIESSFFESLSCSLLIIKDRHYQDY